MTGQATTRRQAQVTVWAQAQWSVAQMAEVLGCGQTTVGRLLTRWVRQTGTVDISPWVDATTQQVLTDALDGEAPPTATQLAQTHGVAMWQVALVHAVRWNARFPAVDRPDVPKLASGAPDLDALCHDRWTLPQMVRATGLHPGTLELHVAAFLAAQPSPDPSPWLEDAQLAKIEALLDGPNAFYAIRRAQARSEVSRGQVAIVRATRGQWQPRADFTRPAAAAPPPVPPAGTPALAACG